MSEKETRFTPGPWVLIPREAELDEDDNETGAFVYPGGIEANDGSPVCVFGWNGGSGTLFENEADHHLIAAAPDLYEVVKEGREAAAKLAEHYRHAGDDKLEIKWCRVVDRCDAALSKALGETP